MFVAGSVRVCMWAYTGHVSEAGSIQAFIGTRVRMFRCIMLHCGGISSGGSKVLMHGVLECTGSCLIVTGYMFTARLIHAFGFTYWCLYWDSRGFMAAGGGRGGDLLWLHVVGVGPVHVGPEQAVVEAYMCLVRGLFLHRWRDSGGSRVALHRVAGFAGG